MGKKHKTRDIWDLSPEEQSKQAEDIYAIESGDFNILSMTKVGKGVNSRGFSHGLESEIAKDMIGKKSTTVSLNDETAVAPSGKTNMEEMLGRSPKKYTQDEESQQIEIDVPTEIDQPETVYTMPVSINMLDNQHTVKLTPANITSARYITFNVINILNRLVVDDGIAPTSFSFDIGLSQELMNNYDMDDIGDMTVDLFSYIISLKHPTAIYEYDDFINRDFWKFGSVSDDSYNHNKYLFLKANGYVYCYLIDTDSVDSFYNHINDSELSKDDILRVFVSLAYAAGTMQQAFFIEEDAYTRSFMHSQLNNQKEFHNIFADDLSTKLVPNGKDVTDSDGIILTSAEDLQTYARELIGKITGSSYFGDDDDWDDNDDDDWDDQSDDFEPADNDDAVSHTEDGDYTIYDDDSQDIDDDSDDMSDLLSDDMEVIQDDEDTESNGEFVVDVIRKK